MCLNISKIEKLMKERNLRKADVIARSGISKGTLENVLKGMDAKISTVKSLSDVLGVCVGELFFEEEVEIRTAGRDYVEKGNIVHHGTEYNGDGMGIESELREQINVLKSQLEDKERIIQLLMKGEQR